MSRDTVAETKAVLDAMVASAADPVRAMAAIVTVWSWGAPSAEDLLDDLVDIASTEAHLSGHELTFAEVLDLAGQRGRAAHLRAGLEEGRAALVAAVKPIAMTVPYVELCRRREEPDAMARAQRQLQRIWADFPTRTRQEAQR